MYFFRLPVTYITYFSIVTHRATCFGVVKTVSNNRDVSLLILFNYMYLKGRKFNQHLQSGQESFTALGDTLATSGHTHQLALRFDAT